MPACSSMPGRQVVCVAVHPTKFFCIIEAVAVFASHATGYQLNEAVGHVALVFRSEFRAVPAPQLAAH
eukprot:4581644-Amphidinium_carterae.1